MSGNVYICPYILRKNHLNLDVNSQGHPSLAATSGDIGYLYRQLDVHRKATEFSEKPLEIFKKIYRTDHLNLVAMQNNTKLGEYQATHDHLKKGSSY